MHCRERRPLILDYFFLVLQSNSEEGWATPNAPTPLSKEEIVRSIEFLNANYEVLNVDKYGPVQNISSVIVVQVLGLSY